MAPVLLKETFGGLGTAIFDIGSELRKNVKLQFVKRDAI